jgi:tetratricopeptide (TPR) repeat protein
MEVQALETARKEPRGGRIDVSLGAFTFTTTDLEGKPRPSSPRAQALLRDRDMTFIVDPQGALQQRTVPTLNPPYPADLREDFAELVHQIANSYEMTCLAVPGRQVEARETWPARVPLILAYQEKKLIVDMFLTCTYEGCRGDGAEQYAVISLSGYLKSRKTGRQSAAGSVTGKVHFAIADGYLSLANVKVESEGEDDDVSVAHSLELSLTRARGNTANIVARPAAPVPGPAPAAGTDYELAVPHIQKREFDKAIPLLEKAVAANPNHVQALAELGFAYNETGLFDKAIPCFRKVIELVPNHVTAHNNLGAAYNGKKLYDDAIPCFKKAIELDPNHATAHGNLGYAYNAKKLYDQAIPCFEKVIALDPQRADAYRSLGFACNEQRLYDRAIACLKKALELDPKHVTVLNNLGHAYNGRGLYDDAVPCFKKALELDPKHVVALNNLGHAYNVRGLYDQGIPCLKRRVEVQPKYAPAYENLGTALGDVGELEQACEVLKKGLALTPETAPQFEPRKRALEQMEALLRLERELQAILKGERKPKDFQEGVQFGKVCRLKQHYGAALRFYEQAIAGDPEAAKKLAPGDFVTLARTALLASAGAGSDPPPEADRPQYRAKALAWLEKFVKAAQEALEKNLDANRYSCQGSVRVLLQHKDLAPVREPALNNLPAGERKDWENFWNEVETLLEKADALPSDPSAGQNP